MLASIIEKRRALIREALLHAGKRVNEDKLAALTDNQITALEKMSVITQYSWAKYWGAVDEVLGPRKAVEGDI